ncbi:MULTISPECIES: sugar kinase [Pseudoalteromonas]|uniref:sugar kinase n=1 Tax=Pseudoalteromonas TaxID=53246 RepID=UPI000BBEDCAC|nr:sugar kinase [Pseudoalteromonas sp. 1_2015MBL_MicDiv]ATG79695.1 ketodeoxygluconokinase [Pseudoalteromonas sp. 1_2015MBL_MicDiv]
MSIKKIAIIGECMVELSGQLFSSMQQNYGGDTMNTAIYLKKLAGQSVDVNYVTCMGADTLSTAMIKQWQKHQLNTDFVLIAPDKQVGLYMIQNDVQGERSFQYWRSDSAAKYLVTHPDFNHIVALLSHFDAIYLSGISLAILSVKDCNTLLEILTKLAHQGVDIIYDSNHRPALWASDEHCKKTNKVMYALANLSLLTFDDEVQIWADNNITACHFRLHKAGAQHVLIKTGADGCQYSNKNTSEPRYFKTNKVDNVTDTTAAGDSFNAGFLAYWLHGNSIEDCAKAGNLLAGQVIQHRGAIVGIDTDSIKTSIIGR